MRGPHEGVARSSVSLPSTGVSHVNRFLTRKKGKSRMHGAPTKRRVAAFECSSLQFWLVACGRSALRVNKNVWGRLEKRKRSVLNMITQ